MKTYAILLTEVTSRGHRPIGSAEFTGELKGPGEVSLALMNAAQSVRSQPAENGHAKIEISEEIKE